jgi:tetratricopeptide (TPR) repeat protein
LRERFSEEAVRFYESLLQEESSNPNLRYEAAVGYRSIGTLHTTAGQPEQADEAFRRSVAILDPLVTQHPANPQYRQQLGWSLLNLGRTLRTTERVEEAKTTLLRGVDQYEKLLTQVPSSFGYRNELATCYLELNRSYADTGDFQRAEETIDLAIRTLETAVAQQPEPQFQEQLARMHLSLGQLRARNGRIEEAKAAYREAADRYEDAFSTSQNVGILYHWAWSCQGLIELPLAMSEAEQAYQKLLEIRSLVPTSLKSHRDLRERFGHAYGIWGFRLRSAGRLEEAEKAFLEAASIFDKLIIDELNFGKYHPFAANAHREVGRLMRLGSRHDEAERELRRSIEFHEQRESQFPNLAVDRIEHAACYFEFAQLLIKTGRLSETVPLVTRGVEVNPANNGHPIELQAQVKLGDLLREAGEFDQALAKYSEAVATKPDLAEAWAGRGECQRQFGNFAKMAEDYSAAIELKPDEQWYWHERGYAYLVLGEHEKSIADHSKSIALGDTDAGQRQRRGTSYEALEDFAKAEQDYSRAIELGPREWWTWHSRARLYRTQGQSEKAQSDLANAAKFANDPDAQNEIASKLVTDPDPSWRNPMLAVELAERAIGARPGDGLIWNTVGAARYRNGQWKDAIAAFEKSMELRNGGDSNDWFFLAMCHWQLGDKEQARVWYHKAVEWMDNNQPQNAELGRIRDEATQLITNHTEATTQGKTE